MSLDAEFVRLRLEMMGFYGPLAPLERQLDPGPDEPSLPPNILTPKRMRERLDHWLADARHEGASEPALRMLRMEAVVVMLRWFGPLGLPPVARGAHPQCPMGPLPKR